MGFMGLKVKGKVRFWVSYRLRMLQGMDCRSSNARAAGQDNAAFNRTTFYVSLSFCWLRAFVCCGMEERNTSKCMN